MRARRRSAIIRRSRRCSGPLFFAILSFSALATSGSSSLQKQNDELFQQLRTVQALTDAQLDALRRIFAESGYVGQGNPAVTVHPMAPEECRAKLDESGVRYENPQFEAICGAKYMAPLYDPAKEKPEDARACIDQFEFPNIPCAYPVVWVRAREAALICEALDKRICDAHEWEGACAGSLEEPDYPFELAKGLEPAEGIRAMRAAHNRVYATKKVWSYGPQYRTGICAASSSKTDGCEGGNWDHCGSNTFPAGAFPDCRSNLTVYDLNGNAAEHMNLPLDESQMSSKGSKTYGYTEMKGSWFIFDHYKAHEDACRWRAPFWHGSELMDPKSHHNYHLGFRCCKTVGD
jgi:hypothetical protein